MHWTPLSGAKFEDVFGPSGTPARQNSRRRHHRPKSRPTIESLESRLTPAITAGIVASSLASTSGSNVTIGEVVRMRVVVPENLAGNFDPTAFNVQGTLPAGLQFLAGTADMALVSQNGIVSTLDPTNAGGLSVTGANVNSVTPTFLIPSSAITVDPTTGAVIFNTGISHANDDGSVADYVVIEFNALVENVAANQAAPPTTLTSSFMVFIGGTTCNCTGTDTLNVVEPSITNLTKTAQVSADGNTATYTLTFSNTGNSTAYDVRVVDNLPAGLTLNPNSVQVVGGSGLVDKSSGTGLDLTFDSIAAGGSVTITYSAAIPAAAKNGQAIVNTVNLDYTSLPGPNGENPNPTGSVTPGASGSPTGERDGSGGVNDYFDSAQATISVQSPHVNSLAGFVFVDENHSGDFDAGDLLISGAVITLQDANGNPVHDLNGNLVGPITTGVDGSFSFTNLADGTYQLRESYDDAAHMLMDGNDFPGLINGVQDTTASSDPSPGDRIFNIVLTGGVAGTQYRFGECPCPPPSQTSINGFVYFDQNCNGIKEASEQGIVGVRVQLTNLSGNPVLDLNGNPVAIATTDANGFYQFLNLPAGAYRVTELPPQPTFQGNPTVDGLDTAGTVNGVTRGVALNDIITGIALVGGENSINNDFGECPPSNVGAINLSGHVYFDSNRDLIRDTGDLPIAGATLVLFRIDANGVTQVAQTTTNNRGEYLFEIDTPGVYRVVSLPVAKLIREVANVGRVNGVLRGSAPTLDDLDAIGLADGDSGINYDFGLISNTPPPPPFSKQQLLANQPAGAGLGSGVGAATAFATDPSFANINRAAGTTHIVAVGADAGGGPNVRVFDFTSGKQLFNFFAYSPSFTGGVRVAVGDVNGDGTPDVITAPGAGGGPQIKVFDGKTGALIRSFWAFSPTFTGGVYVAAGDVNGDGISDIIVGAGAGGGPQVKVFDGATGAVIANFYAFGSTFTGGVRVAAGDFNMDGRADIVAGAGPGGGPQVKIFNAATLGVGGAPLIANFYAFAPTFRGGVNVAANSTDQGDITGDGRTDLVVGTGSGIGEVKVIDGASFTTFADFTAYDSSLTNGGVHVSVFDLNGDGRADVVAGAGGGDGGFVRVVNVATDQDLEFFQAFNPAFLGGAWVAGA